MLFRANRFTVSVFLALLMSLRLWSPGHSGCSAAKPDPLCGPVAIQAVLAHYGVKASIDEIRPLCLYDETSGTTLKGVRDAFESKGLHGRAMKISVDELLKSQLPSVVHCYDSHFVAILHGVSSDEVILVDGTSRRSYSRTAFLTSRVRANLSGFAVLVSDDATKFPAASTDVPDLRSDTYMWNFGITDFGAPVQHVFKLRNAGSKPLKLLKIEPLCTCVSAHVSGVEVSPGVETDLSVTLDASKQGWQREEIKITSNDPATPVVRLLIRGFVRPVQLLPSPQHLEFPGAVRYGTGAETTMFVPQYPDHSVNISKVDLASAFITVKVQEVADVNRPGYNVILKLSPDAPIGEATSKITIHTTHYKQTTVDVFVKSKVIGPINCEPNQVYLSLAKGGPGAKMVLTLRNLDNSPFKIDRITSPSWVSAQDTTSAASVHRVTATLSSTAPTGYLSGNIIVHTDVPQQSDIIVPVFAQVTGR